VVVPFFVIDSIFLAANALKIPAGGWMPLLVGIGLFTLMMTWRRGSRLLTRKARAGRLSLTDCIHMTERGSVQRVPGTAVFLTGNAGDVPSALLHNLKHNMVLHKLNYILTVETEDIPHVDNANRLTIEKLSESFSQMKVRFGFMESPNIPQALASAGFDVMKISFFLSRRALKPDAHSGMPLWQDHFFIALARSASDASDHFCIPESRAIEIGMQIAV
jgi:KUP system potassium uptake protein